MNACERLNICGFFNKYEHSTQIDCRGFINTYCKGGKQHECARLEYLKKHNIPPSDDMLPSGKIVESEEKYEPYGNNSQQYY